MNNAEYTSNLLCHFVGRAQPTEESQYRLLLKIINYASDKSNTPIFRTDKGIFLKYPQTKETIEQFALKYLSEEGSKNDGIIKLFSYISGAWATQCAYAKLYDSTLPDDDLNNFYMEREWRCRNNIPISIDDIDTIYLPNEVYKLHFVKDVPEYKGNFYVFE